MWNNVEIINGYATIPVDEYYDMRKQCDENMVKIKYLSGRGEYEYLGKDEILIQSKELYNEASEMKCEVKHLRLKIECLNNEIALIKSRGLIARILNR